MKNLFFKKKNNLKINDILKVLNLKQLKKNIKIDDIKELDSAGNNDITFFNSIKYLDALKKTKSKFVITNKKLKIKIPEKFNVIEVNDVLLSISLITNLFYPGSLDDNFDDSVTSIDKKKFSKLKVGKNVLVGKNVKIGINCSIGNNSIIESNVKIGNNCNIGSNVILKNFNAIFGAENSPALKARTDLKSKIVIDEGDTFTSVLDNHIESMERFKSYAKGVH